MYKQNKACFHFEKHMFCLLLFTFPFIFCHLWKFDEAWGSNTILTLCQRLCILSLCCQKQKQEKNVIETAFMGWLKSSSVLPCRRTIIASPVVYSECIHHFPSVDRDQTSSIKSMNNWKWQLFNFAYISNNFSCILLQY